MVDNAAKAVNDLEKANYLLRADVPGTKKRKRLRNDVPPGASVSVFMRDGSWSFTTVNMRSAGESPVSFTRDDEALVSVVAKNPDAVMRDVTLRLMGSLPSDDDIERYAAAAAERMLEGVQNVGTTVQKRGWENPLPEELHGISPDSLGVERDCIFVWLSQIGGELGHTEARARESLMRPDIARATVLFVHADPKAFRRHHDVLDGLWDKLVSMAVKRGDCWLDLLPQEFEDVKLDELFQERDVLFHIENLGGNDESKSRAESFFRYPLGALSAVIHIDRNPGVFRRYENTIRPRWHTWVQTARQRIWQ
jgi:hypothetical protein